MKPTLVAFEGIDKVGKSVVREIVRKDMKFGPIPMDRFLASNFAYDCYYNREHYIQDYVELEKSLLKSFNMVLVYLTCNPAELNIRLEKENSEITPQEVYDIITPDIYFAAYFYYSQFRKIIIDTSYRSAKLTAKIVQEFIESNECVSTKYMSKEWAANIKLNCLHIEVDTLAVYKGEQDRIFKGNLEEE